MVRAGFGMTMPRLHRPYIPLHVRILVLERQLGFPVLPAPKPPNKEMFDHLLEWLSDRLGGPLHLDHDPPLCLRDWVVDHYVPDANDPDYLIYRTAADHDIKTRVRGDGAKRSDLAQRRYLKKCAANRLPGKHKRRIPKRANFKWPSRPIQRRQVRD
jgi:hypothetical protein